MRSENRPQARRRIHAAGRGASDSDRDCGVDMSPTLSSAMRVQSILSVRLALGLHRDSSTTAYVAVQRLRGPPPLDYSAEWIAPLPN